MTRVLVLALLVVGIGMPETATGRAAGRGHRSGKQVKRLKKVVAVPTFTKDGLPNVRAASAIIVDLDTGAELYAKNPDEIRPIASVGKLFLAMAVRGKSLPLDGATEIREEDKRFASGGSRSRLPVGKSFLNHDLLRAMLVSSDNRACTALGRAVGLSPQKLIEAMNEKARLLGLTKTRFDDPTGLNGNVSTAREMALALRASLADPVLAEVLATPTAIVRSVGARPLEIHYFSTNLSLRTQKRVPILGGKTGYTDEARYCLAIAARVGERRLGMVFLGAEGELTRFADFNRSVAWLNAKATPDPVAAKK